MNGTYLARDDVIIPMAEGEGEYPGAFQEGAVVGLLFDENGYFVSSAAGMSLAFDVMLRITPERRTSLGSELADLAGDAEVRTSATSAIESAAALRARLSTLEPGHDLAQPLRTLATQIQRLGRTLAPPDPQ